jgi:molybdopterin converting factor small subunit
MIEIKAVYHAVFEELAGRPGEQITIDQSNFGALIEQLDLRYGHSFGDTLLDRRTGYFKAGVIALANGRQLEPSTALADGDEVFFLVAMAGGSAPGAVS